MRRSLAGISDFLAPLHDARTQPVVDPRQAPQPRCLVVRYRYIHDPAGGDGQLTQSGCGLRGITLARLEEQIDRLCDALEPIQWPAFSQWMQGQGDIPPSSFLLTFDGGLLGHAQYVLPALERRGLRGVFFIPGAVLTRRRMLAVHAVHLMLEVLGESMFAQHLGQTLAQAGVEAALTPGDRAKALQMYPYERPALAEIKYLLTMKLPLAVCSRVVDEMFARHVGPHECWAKRWYVSRSEVYEMHSRGHAVGGQGFEHEPCGRLSAEEFEADARQSAAALEEILGSEARPFAYPFGSVHEKGAEILKRSGFVQAFTREASWVNPMSRPMKLPRIDTMALHAALEPTPAPGGHGAT